MTYADLHIHSCYSFDSLMDPCEILIRAKKVGLGVIAITDHGTIEGAIETRDLADNEFGVQVIVGEEIGTDIGDIIGLDLEERVPSGRKISYGTAIDAIHEQGGIAVLPHPYRDHKLITPGVAGQFDLIETYNGRCTHRQNERAETMRNCLGIIPTIYGSDAHFYSEIGSVKMPFSELKHAGFLVSWLGGGIDYVDYCTKPLFWQRFVLGSRAIKFLKNRDIIKTCASTSRGSK